MAGCVFCARIRNGADMALRNDEAVAFADKFPIAEGHMLVVPVHHVSRLEDLDEPAWIGVFRLTRVVARDLAAREDVDGVNVGVNSGTAAGQTIDHAHVHVVPRRHGDVADPKGGVRRLIPELADYWSQA